MKWAELLQQMQQGPQYLARQLREVLLDPASDWQEDEGMAAAIFPELEHMCAFIVRRCT